MGNKIFNTILFRKIENFVSTFVEDSTSIFYNDKKLIHPGEFGKYRENSIKDLLQVLTKYKVSDGFIITSNGKISTQCDVVIYDNFDFPVLENNLAQFFSIESVKSIGEVKSTLSKNKFKKALRKLAENKKLAENIIGEPTKITLGDEYNPPISFLVCKNLTFPLDTLNLEEIYEDIPKIYWHNLILVIEQGLFTYDYYYGNLSNHIKESFNSNGGNIEQNNFFPNSLCTLFGEKYECNMSFIEIDKNDKFKHIKLFITGFSQAILYKTTYQTEIIHYMEYPIPKLFNN
jgi:hypothetical protein